MKGISSTGKDRINSIIEDMFDKIALQFLGNIPKLKNKKFLVISHQSNLGLANLFVQAMQNKTPNAIEQDALKSLLDSAHNYIESLKNKTKSSLTERIDGIVRDASVRKEKPSQALIDLAVKEEMQKASNHLKVILEAESTKLRNLGTLMDISRVASNVGDSDPMVATIEPKDGKTCQYCLKNHFTEDGNPRVFRFSELKHGYVNTAEKKAGVVSLYGQHPNCRMVISYIAKGFGFKDGKLTYIDSNHDEHAKQRK